MPAFCSRHHQIIKLTAEVSFTLQCERCSIKVKHPGSSNVTTREIRVSEMLCFILLSVWCLKCYDVFWNVVDLTI